jgi:transcriptional regulator GlxA family with amidase domain
MEHLSVSRYCFLFKRRFGVSPQKYILELRISTAKELLTSTDLPIKEIGSACGYADPHFFSRIFCKSCGVSPTEYRRGIREN